MAARILQGRTAGGLAWEATGAGEAIVLVHAGVAERPTQLERLVREFVLSVRAGAAPAE